MIDPIAPPEPASKRRRRSALSLRGLMVLVLVVGGVLGWKVRRATIQREAVAEIEKAGGWFYFDYQKDNFKAQPWAPAWLRRRLGEEYFREPTAVLFGRPGSPNSPPTDAAIDAIARLDRVEMVEFLASPITDANLAALARSPTLKRLGLVKTAVTAGGLAGLRQSPSLEHIHMRFGRSKPAGEPLAVLADVAGLKELEIFGLGPTEPADLAPLAKLRLLEWVHLSKSPEDDSCLAHFRGMENLACLDLHDTRVTDAGMANLASFPRLDRIRLNGSRLSDAGLAHLARMPGLKEIYLPTYPWPIVPGVTDAGLRHMSGLRSLTELTLPGARITDEGLDALRGLALESLNLSGLDATEAGMIRLLEGKNFRDLMLTGKGPTDAWMPLLSSQASTLRVLALARSGVTDAGMARLASLPKLEVLSLSETALTDTGLATIGQSATKLTFLDIRGTRVTAEGIDALKAARPGITVMSGPAEPTP